MALAAVYIQGGLFVGNIVSAESLMAIYTRQAGIAVRGGVESFFIYKKADRLPATLHRESGVRVTGQAVIVC